MSLAGEIQAFLSNSRRPVLFEAGEDPMAIAPESFVLTPRGASVMIECWNETRNLVRCVRAIHREQCGRLELEVDRFGAAAGRLTLLDLAHPSNHDMPRRGTRLKYREQFRRSLHRQFPEWRIAGLSTEPDLHHSLSPSYPRALLRKGASAIAAIGAAAGSPAPEGVLSFGLIWLDYLRRRETRVQLEALAIFVPPEAQSITCHRVRYLDPQSARYLVFVHHLEQEDAVDPGDYTNFETRLEPCRRVEAAPVVERLAAVEGVERRDRPDGSISLAVRGLEFARAIGSELIVGIGSKYRSLNPQAVEEAAQLAAGLAGMRSADAADVNNPLYWLHPEAWLESQVRTQIERLDASLLPAPVYGQVPEFAAGDRSVFDLLAADRDGRLVVIELKADQDIHLPLQALDYWMRVKWHLDRNEFQPAGYFPGLPLTPRAPRLLLVAPALDWHPANEVVLGYFSPEIAAERIGLGIEWKRELRVMFRTPARSWPSPFYAR